MKSIFSLLTIFISIIIFSSCAHYNHDEHESEVTNEHLLYATIYQQKSAEIAALQMQAFNIAYDRLNEILATDKGEKPLAIIVDVDETVLDNSPFESKSILENSDYPKYWDEWCELAEAKALPGASEFLNYAASKGVETFYVTNRKIHLQEATKKNLLAKGFPHVDDDHMMLRDKISSKESRRLKILETYEIVILMGDNLGDLSQLFDDQKSLERHKTVQSLQSEFGRKFIVLPNSMYGAWVDALIQNPTGMSKSEKLDALKSILEDF